MKTNTLFLAALSFLLCARLSAKGDAPFEFVIQSGHTGSVTALAFSHDGARLYSGGADGKIAIWNLEAGFQTGSFREHSRSISRITPNRDGSRILSSDFDFNALIWNADSLLVEGSFNRAARWTHALYSPNGEFIVTYNIFAADKPFDPILRKSEDGSELFTLDGHQNDVAAVAFSLDGKSVATASFDHGARVYETATGKGLWLLEHQSAVQDIVFAGKNDEYAATIESAGYELMRDKPRNAVFLWSMKTGKLAKKLQFSKQPPRQLAYNAQSDLLFALGDDHKIALWNVKTLAPKGVFEDKRAEIQVFAVDPSGRFLAYGCEDGNIVLVDVATLQEVKRFSNHVVTYTSLIPLENMRLASIDEANQHLTLWDLKKCERLFDFEKPMVKMGVDEVNQMPIYQERTFAVDRPGAHVFVTEGGTLSCMNAETGLPRYAKKVFPEPILATSVNDAGSMLALAGGHALYLATAADGAQAASVPFNAEGAHRVQFSPKPDEVFYSDGNELVRFNYRSKQRSVMATFKEPIKGLFASGATLGAYSEKKLAVLSTATGAEVMSYTSVLKDIDRSIISSDGRYILKSNNQLMDIQEQDALWTGDFPARVSSGRFIQNDSKLLLSLSDGSLVLYDAKTGRKIARYLEMTVSGDFGLGDMRNMSETVFKKGISSIVMFPDDSVFAIAATGMPELRIARVTDYSSLIHKLYVLAVGKNDYVMYHGPSTFGYAAPYLASKGAVKGLAFKKGDEIYSFQDCDLMLNHPDWVMRPLEWADKNQTEMYGTLTYKRKRRALGKDAPKVIIESVGTLGKDIFGKRPSLELRAAPPLITGGASLSVPLAAASVSGAPLDHINVYLNGAKIDHAIPSAKIASESSVKCEQTLTLPLASGLNSVQLSVVDTKGNESLRKNFTVTSTRPKKKGVLYLVTVGVSEYGQSAYNLTYASKDAGDVANYFEKNKKNYDDVKVVRLMNKEATKANILAAGAKLSGATVDDEVIFFFAGHGLLDADLNYYMANTDIDFDDPGKNGVLYDDVMTMIEELPALRKVVLIDACHSGELEKDAELQLAAAAPVPQANVRMVAGATRGMKSAAAPKVASSRMKDLFLNFSNTSGIAVITSAGGAEFALESSQWKNGVFTYNLLDGLQSRHADLDADGVITVSELKEYVSQRVKEMTNGMQMPTTRNENMVNDFRVY